MVKVDFIELYVLTGKPIEDLDRDPDQPDWESMGVNIERVGEDYEGEINSNNTEWKPILIRPEDIKDITEVFLKPLMVYALEVYTSTGELYLAAGRQKDLEATLQIEKVVFKPKFID